MADENITPDDVEISDLVKVEFPRVNENAVRAVAETEKPKTENGELRGYNPEIHEYPPRKNKFGEWAKKRGNKKGFRVGGNKAAENPQQPEKTEKPPLEIPETENVQSENAPTISEIELTTDAAAALFSKCFYVGLNIWSDYEPSQMEADAHKAAAYKYLMSRGGMEMPPWAELAAISMQSVYAASKKEKAKTKIQKFREWLAGKIYAFRNRKKNGAKTENMAA